MSDLFNAGELEELLGRRPRAEIGPVDRAAFAGKRVLITGAAGSIGSTLARELAACRPASLAIVDQSELGLFNVEREIRRHWPRLELEAWLLDVSREAAIARACRVARPDIVYHAAAYKHVTMAERCPAATLGVNVLGSAATARAAARAGARFVLISTDKAANPESVMGATKRLAEMVVLQMASNDFRPIVVRFGNVLGSSGSVVQVMCECIRAGRPIPVTDPEATRFFMTSREAVALVVRADRLGDAPRIFWLDMGDPIRLADLAVRLLDREEALGYARVPLQVVGLRPGEKRTETLIDPRLIFDRTVDRCIRVAREHPHVRVGLARTLSKARRAVANADDLAALALLSATIEGFTASVQASAHAEHTAEPDVRPRSGRTRRLAAATMRAGRRKGRAA